MPTAEPEARENPKPAPRPEKSRRTPMSRKLIAHQTIDIVKPLMAWFKGAAHRRTLADMPPARFKPLVEAMLRDARADLDAH